ncbi:hypothetical protein B0G69_3041 [Paraburkholderia sp. RAU2J]|nr:hypothetical protein B0G69_3041 [Paraburkholderia sp. RAU2J]
MLKASNIFELFSIFVAVFFPRNVARAVTHAGRRAHWPVQDGAWAVARVAGPAIV